MLLGTWESSWDGDLRVGFWTKKIENFEKSRERPKSTGNVFGACLGRFWAPGAPKRPPQTPPGAADGRWRRSRAPPGGARGGLRVPDLGTKIFENIEKFGKSPESTRNVFGTCLGAFGSVFETRAASVAPIWAPPGLASSPKITPMVKFTQNHPHG